MRTIIPVLLVLVLTIWFVNAPNSPPKARPAPSQTVVFGAAAEERAASPAPATIPAFQGGGPLRGVAPEAIPA